MREPALTHPQATIYLGDCLDVLAEMPDNTIDAIVTDPPYGLGFMGKAWDDLPPGLPWAEECLRVLKPGGHLLAFGGTRTWHRLAVAVEDAGFEVRDSIAWLYGSGFPKSLDVSKAIDKQRDDRDAIVAVTSFMADHAERHGVTRADVDEHMGTSDMSGWWLSRLRHRCQVPKVDQYARLKELLRLSDDMDAEVWRLNGRKGTPGEAWEQREVVGDKLDRPGYHLHASDGGATWTGMTDSADKRLRAAQITAPATPAAQQWQGWGTALKPAFEPIVVARKPLIGTVAANVLAHGTGALNIDATRVGDEVRTNPPVGDLTSIGSSRDTPKGEGRTVTGRWPANVLLDGSQADALDADQPVTTSQGGSRGAGAAGYEGGALRAQPDVRTGIGDTGGPSRYFPTFRYQAKAPTRERPTYVKETEPCDENSGSMGPSTTVPTRGSSASTSPTEPADTATSSPRKANPRAIGMKRCALCGKQAVNVRPSSQCQCPEPKWEAAASSQAIAHPTVKPLALMRWLVRLVTPPGGTVLDTFAGSGATIEAAALEGFQSIGIEREADYLPLIQVRLDRLPVADEGDTQ